MAGRNSLLRPSSSRTFVAILAIGFVISLAFAGFEAKRPGVYWSRVQVQFLLPQSTDTPNVLSSSSAALVTTAGVVAKMVDPDSGEISVASPAITMADQGVKHGSSVTLPNSGGQWSLVYNQPYLDVQAVGTTPDEALALIQTRVDQVTQALTAIQADAGVPQKNRITTQLSPPNLPVYYQKGSSIRAGLAALVIGMSLSWLVAAVVRRRVYQRVPWRGVFQPWTAVPAGAG